MTRDAASIKLLDDSPSPPPAVVSSRLERVAQHLGQGGQPDGATALALRAATVAIAGSGPLVPPVVSQLAAYGVGGVRLIGDAEVSDLAVQQSQGLLRTDVGRKTSDVLKERLLPDQLEVGLTVRPQVPESKLEWQEALAKTALTVVVVDGPILFYPWLDALNEAAQDGGHAWISAALLEGRELHVGPMIVPGKTACYKCYELRYKSNLNHLEASKQFESFIQQSGVRKDLGMLPPLGNLVAGIVALEVVRAISPTLEPLSLGRLLTFDVTMLTTFWHPVLKLPRCPVCSPATNAPAARTWR